MKCLLSLKCHRHNETHKMNKRLTIKDMTKLSAMNQIWATEMDILAAKTRQLTALKDRQLLQMNDTLERVAVGLAR